MSSSRSIGKFVQSFALLLLLFAFPLGSWYYLQSGLNYQKKARAELKNYGEIAPFSMVNQHGKLVDKEQLKGKLTVAAVANGAKSTKNQYLELLQRLQEQFDKRPELVFLTYVIPEEQLPGEALAAFTRDLELKNDQQVLFVSADQLTLKAQVLESYRLPGANESFSENSWIALADSLTVIRNFYDYSDPKQVKRLVEHIALLLPMEKTEDPELRRTPEK